MTRPCDDRRADRRARPRAARGLKATLASLQAAGGAPFRLVLLPDGPDPATARGAHDAAAPAGGSHHGARAAGMLQPARGRDRADVIVLLESGCVRRAGLARGAARGAAPRPGVGLAGPSTNLAWNEQARFRAGGPGDVTGAEEARRRFGIGSARSRRCTASPTSASRSGARSIDAIGAADEGFGLGPCWEMEYSARALRAGFEAVWVCGAYVHRAPFTPPARPRGARALRTVAKRRYQDARLRAAAERQRQRLRARTAAATSASTSRPRTLMRCIARSAQRHPYACRPPTPLVSCIMPTRRPRRLRRRTRSSCSSARTTPRGS